MKLSKLISGLNLKGKSGPNVNISTVEYDSRHTVIDSMFICIDGFHVDGHLYIESAIKHGSSCIVVEKEEFFRRDLKNTSFLFVENTKSFLAKISAIFYGNPMSNLDIVGITGTKGKTMTTFMAKSVFDADNQDVAISTTIKKIIKDREISSLRTTPESSDLQRFFAEAVDSGIRNVIMEVSSLGIKRQRLEGVSYYVAVFLNLTQDHISENEHSDIDDYFNSKMKIFNNCKFAIINIDDVFGLRALSIARKKVDRVYTLSVKDSRADIFAKDISLVKSSIHFNLISPWYNSPIVLGLPGEFNVLNALAVVGISGIFALSLNSIQKGLARVTIPGRLEKVENNKGFDVIIDYAHTPDSLEKILTTYKSITSGRLFLVFGCGGNRDQNKRSVMGNISGRISDHVFITSDNPRDENPIKIITQIEAGMAAVTSEYTIIPDRSEAIRKALSLLKKGDCLIIAGKGHESSQEINGEFLKFNDREEVEKFL